MEYLIENNIVFTKKEIKTSTQTAIIKSMLNHGHVYNIVLLYSNNKVYAEYRNYLNELQTDFAGNIIFDLEGEQITVQAVNGIAEIDFTSTFPGQYIVKTVNENISNGSVIINVE